MKLVGLFDQVPSVVLNVWPFCAVPETTGNEVLTGAGGFTTAVCTDVAVFEPPALEAVTDAPSVEPTSADCAT